MEGETKIDQLQQEHFFALIGMFEASVELGCLHGIEITMAEIMKYKNIIHAKYMIIGAKRVYNAAIKISGLLEISRPTADSAFELVVSTQKTLIEEAVNYEH